MSFSEEQDAVWRKELPTAVYNALRHGTGEAPHTGAYEKTALAGTYHCAGCGNPLFDSEQKIVDDSGYAAFGVGEEDGTVQFVRTYSEDGSERTTAVCVQCQGTIGLVGSTVVHRSEEFAQAAGKRCVHAYSLSLTLRKAFTPRNHPLAYLSILLFVAATVAMGWYWLQGMVSGAVQLSRVSGEVSLSVGDFQVQAAFMQAPTDSSAGISVSTQALLVVLDSDTRSVRLADRKPLDLLWLDETYSAISGQVNVVPSVSNAIDAPSGARLVLVAPTGMLPAELFTSGVFVYFNTNKLVQ